MSWLTGVVQRSSYWRGFPVLPGAVPVLGHLPTLMFDGVGALRRGYEALGPLFWVRFGMRNPVLFCADSESFELLKHKSVTMKGAFEGLERMIGDSTIVRDGAPHQRVRSALNPIFSMRGILSSGVGAVMARTVIERIERWVALRELPVLKETQELALDIIFRVAGVTGNLDEWRRQNREFALLLWPLPTDLPGSPRRRGMRAADWIDAGLLQIAQRARSEPEGHSLTHSMVRAVDDQGNTLTDQELVDNLRILLFAGHETTASALAWIALMLAQQPKLWDQLVAESLRFPSDAPISIAEAKTLPFGEALFREALRRYAPIWFTRRKLLTELDYAGYRIPQGTSIALGIGSYLMDPKRYAQPERFDPGRWLERPASPTPIEMAAFGGGAHFCLGYHLAWLEVQQFLVALARKMHAAGLRPRMPDGPAPREIFFPVRHPFGSPRILFA